MKYEFIMGKWHAITRFGPVPITEHMLASRGLHFEKALFPRRKGVAFEVELIQFAREALHKEPK